MPGRTTDRPSLSGRNGPRLKEGALMAPAMASSTSWSSLVRIRRAPRADGCGGRAGPSIGPGCAGVPSNDRGHAVDGFPEGGRGLKGRDAQVVAPALAE